MPYYPDTVNHLIGFDLTPNMLKQAELKKYNKFPITLIQADATQLCGLKNSEFDWYISTYMFCVLPKDLVIDAVNQMARVLKPGGHFRIVEIIVSKDETKKASQLEGIKQSGAERYGLNLENNKLKAINLNPHLKILNTRFVRSYTFI